MLWTCLHFPDFSLQLRLRASAQPIREPLIVVSGNPPQVVSCNALARRHGITPGMTVSAAIALAPDLIECLRAPAAEIQALESAAAWAGQFTSLVSVAPPDALLLEIEGSLSLFGGLRMMLQHLSRELGELGYTAAIASAPTPTAARLLARAGISATVIDDSALETALAGLPLSLLDQPEETVRMLALMGVHTVGECLALPRDGLARRFGQTLLDELDRALDRLPDPRASWAAPSRYKAQLALPAPVQETEPLLFAANRLIQELTGFLRMRQTGITRLKLVLHHAGHRPTVVTLGLSVPSRDPHRILRLLRERLSVVSLPERVEAIGLESAETRPLGSRNLSLFPEDRLPEEERWLIIEHLRARLGAEAVYSITSHPDHRPELAWRCCEPGTATASGERMPRPLWLLEPPQRLSSAGDTPVMGSPLTLAAGPERIESGWWDDGEVKRDYFVARDAEGKKLWIFRDRSEARSWFLHGVFA
jgi:protein ImuB